MRFAVLALALLAIALGAHGAVVAAQTDDYDHARGLMATPKKCSISPPVKRDYSWLAYKEMNGFAYKNTRAVGGFFATVKNVKTPKNCFQLCVDSPRPSSWCNSFRYEPATKRCALSNFSIPFDPEDPRDLKTASKWCPAKGYVSGWIIFMYD